MGEDKKKPIQYLTVDNYILYLFSLATLNGVKRLSCSTSKIHQVFCDLKEKYPDIFYELNFMTCEETPFSKELSEVFFGLSFSKCIIVETGLEFSTFKVSKDVIRGITMIVENKLRRDDEKKDVLEKIAKEIEKKLGCYNL